MNADEVTEAILRQLQDHPQSAEEVLFAWRGRHTQAVRAYERWCRVGGEPAYARYRAAQDQADSAQDALRAFHRRVGVTARLRR